MRNIIIGDHYKMKTKTKSIKVNEKNWFELMEIKLNKKLESIDKVVDELLEYCRKDIYNSENEVVEDEKEEKKE